MKTEGRIYSINKNMISVDFDGDVRQNEVAYALVDDSRLKSEVVRIRGRRADLQVFEDTRGLRYGGTVEFTGTLLSAELGPGLLGQLYDGLQNPLHTLAKEYGFFLKRGAYMTALSEEKEWKFTPAVKQGDKVQAGDVLGTVPEGIISHKVMVPFYLKESYEIDDVVPGGLYRIKDKIAVIKDKRGMHHDICMTFEWPVKRAVNIYKERLEPIEPMITKIRLIDTLFPIAKGGTYCTPGPFGAGKTVLQQITSRNAEVDIVVIAACGERAGEVVETIREFPEIIDPLTGRSLMERTIIVANTSSMPVAARESSVYTAVTMAEYYRQMGYDVLLLADSTSRWAQALRERSGRLEEIPGEEAFPAYLESLIANFYERAGRVLLSDGSFGSVTIGGTVSPAGGNFDEPVTQATLKVVGAFHALSRERSDARRYPAIDPLESWTRYTGIIDDKKRVRIRKFLSRANEIDQMMKVVGEEGTPMEDFVLYLKGEFFDRVYLQQNAFDEIDGATQKDRQIKVFLFLESIINAPLTFKTKDEARSFFYKLRQSFLDLNSSAWDSESFNQKKQEIKDTVSQHISSGQESDLFLEREAFIEDEMESTFKRSKKLRYAERELVKGTDEDEKDIL